MKHSYYVRLVCRTGEIEKLPFADIDGACYGVRFERGEGVCFSRNVALEIVNHWNYMNVAQSPTGRYIYWLD